MNTIFLIPIKKYFYFYLKSIQQSYLIHLSNNENRNSNFEFNIMEIGTNDCKNSIIVINKLMKYLKIKSNNKIINSLRGNNKIKILFNNENYISILNEINQFTNEMDENNYIRISNNIDYSLLNKSHFKQITSNESVDFIISTFLFQNSIYDERYYKNEDSIIMGQKTREYSTYCINQLSGLLSLREKELKKNGTMIITIIGEYNILFHKIFNIIKLILKNQLIINNNNNNNNNQNNLIDENNLNNILNKIVLPINFYTKYEINEVIKQLELKKSNLSLVECIGDHLVSPNQDFNQFFIFLNNFIELNFKKLLFKYCFSNNEFIDRFYSLFFTSLKEHLTTKDTCKQIIKDFRLNYYILSFSKK
ncbi:hypothetical protein DICPUDRAFT_74801 [Dictyostelium purpureum]|uniref:Methyltransferase type 11 domain-containing protein n=1 Tax=Dictyostelium purpureum TaxID=5786 RepID=F0Z8S5_DICPU|nr:uncharacterized protein DICPUDRAFT_74801 [Dictyostelium purpureum]EGC39598.1 hypothetical protein DICPUDRAFT_74801 [Dictyostelium purpureum]|eukprot:XP_003283819.1 hypothetical protein DICPUDRAFT_74801 [Dictyostelium purpureum]